MANDFFDIQFDALSLVTQDLGPRVEKAIFKAYQVSLREALEAAKNEMAKIYTDDYPSVPKNLIRGQVLKNPNTGKSTRRRGGGLVSAFLDFPSDNPNEAVAGLQVSGDGIDLMLLKPKQRAEGVAYKGKGGQEVLVKHAFIADVFGTGARVYKRTTAKRFPLKRVWPVAPIDVFKQTENQERVINIARVRFTERYASHVDFFIERALKRDLASG